MGNCSFFELGYFDGHIYIVDYTVKPKVGQFAWDGGDEMFWEIKGPKSEALALRIPNTGLVVASSDSRLNVPKVVKPEGSPKRVVLRIKTICGDISCNKFVLNGGDSSCCGDTTLNKLEETDGVITVVNWVYDN